MSDATVAQKRRERKEKYIVRLVEYLHTYKNVLVIQVDNVGSNQMQKVRIALRGKAVVLMGKNTLMRKIIREEAEKNPKLESLLQFVFGNMGFVFTNGSLNDVRKLIVENKVPASARAGSQAPIDVFVPPGPTGLDPAQTSFFQALNIATKIAKGSIEIVNEVHLIKKGDKVSMSHVALLDKLNIRPFHYGCVVTNVYEDGTTYASSILDMSQSDLMAKFLSGVSRVAAVSLAIGYPTLASLPHLFSGTAKKLIAISLQTGYDFELSKKFKDMLANPGAFAAAAPAAAAPAKGGAAAKKVEEKPAEKDEESEGDMGFSLFD